MGFLWGDWNYSLLTSHSQRRIIALEGILIKTLSEEVGEVRKALWLLDFSAFSNYSHSMSYTPKPTKKFSFSTIIGTLCIRIISIICIIKGFCCQNLLSLIHWQQNLKVSGTAVQMPYYSTKKFFFQPISKKCYKKLLWFSLIICGYMI